MKNLIAHCHKTHGSADGNGPAALGYPLNGQGSGHVEVSGGYRKSVGVRVTAVGQAHAAVTCVIPVSVTVTDVPLPVKLTVPATVFIPVILPITILSGSNATIGHHLSKSRTA